MESQSKGAIKETKPGSVHSACYQMKELTKGYDGDISDTSSCLEKES